MLGEYNYFIINIIKKYIRLGERLVCEADHSTPSTADLKNCGFIHPLSHMSLWHSVVPYSECLYKANPQTSKF
jgi:hypothetical protein